MRLYSLSERMPLLRLTRSLSRQPGEELRDLMSRDLMVLVGQREVTLITCIVVSISSVTFTSSHLVQNLV